MGKKERKIELSNTVNVFFRSVFDIASKNIDEDKFIELRAFNSNGKPVQKYFKYPNELPKFLAESITLNNLMSVYYGIGLRKEHKGTKDATFDNISIIPIDIDVLKDVLGYGDLKKDEKFLEKDITKITDLEAHKLVEDYYKSLNLPLKPTFSFFTGHGIQLYYLLDYPIGEKGLLEFKKLIEFDNKNNKVVNGDSNIYDLARVLRIPFSDNKKYISKKGRVLEINDVKYDYNAVINQFKNYTNYKDEVLKEDYEERDFKSIEEINWDYVPPCVKKALELRKKGEANRDIQLFLRAFFMKVFNQDEGEDVSKTLSIFKEYSNNFNEELTLRSLEEWFNSRRAPTNCMNCPIQECSSCWLANKKKGNPLKAYYIKKINAEEKSVEELEALMLGNVGKLEMECFRGIYNINKETERRTNSDGEEIVRTRSLAYFTKPKLVNKHFFDLHDVLKGKELEINKEFIDIFDDYAFYDFVEVAKSGNGGHQKYLYEYDLIYKWILKKFEVDECKKVTKAWGYYNKDTIILPPEWELPRKTAMLHYKRDFIKLFNEKYEEDDIKKIVKHLKLYLQDDVSKWILEYTMASVFRYYFLSNRKIDMFPNLIVTGLHAQGKSARVRLLFSKLLLNSEYQYGEAVTQGTGIRLEEEQWVNLPMLFDELKEIPKKLEGMIKRIGTGAEDVTQRYRRDGEWNGSSVIRPLLITTNDLNVNDMALISRCIIVDIDDIKTVNTIDEYRWLYDKIHLLGRWIYDNLSMIGKQIENLEFSGDREKAKENVIKIGRAILGAIFSYFEESYTPSSDYPVENYSAVNTPDKAIRKCIIESVRRNIRFNQDGRTYDIYDLLYDASPGVEENLYTMLRSHGLDIKIQEKMAYLIITKDSYDILDIEKYNVAEVGKLKAYWDYKTAWIKGCGGKKAIWMPLKEVGQDEDFEKEINVKRNLGKDASLAFTLIKEEIEKNHNEPTEEYLLITKVCIALDRDERDVKSIFKLLEDKCYIHYPRVGKIQIL
ncbi:hypothetical protein [Methanococcus voltae]|uniref:Uncharacterized protein n=1 Tax=Methanococcus voltae (strain ATCC BAA-1334 / A3) TaxID=456320 RepID=D7DSQ2_METV3|nr:hypothetical protein [Methanococcus voltae]MCS3901763.1 hypothetical protein [Methanococcus voltae]